MSELSPNRWERLWQSAVNATPPAKYFERLSAMYSAPHRHYHNLHHLGDCLHEFDSARQLAREPAAVELAIWFHDAIYDPHACDNEERSAELAKQCLSEAGLDAQWQETVARLILATKHHDGAWPPDAPLLVDVDLSILGQAPERFWQYENQIRAEYEWVPTEIFATKRAEILERFLAREQIYRTDHFFRKYEQQARLNLAASVEELRVA